MEFSKPSEKNYFGHVSDQAVPLNASQEPCVINVENAIQNNKNNSAVQKNEQESSVRAPIDIVCSKQRTVFVVDVDSVNVSIVGLY